MYKNVGKTCSEGVVWEIQSRRPWTFQEAERGDDNGIVVKWFSSLNRDLCISIIKRSLRTKRN